MTSLRKLQNYERQLREWRRAMDNGKSTVFEPKPEELDLKRVEELFCAKRIRDKVMEEFSA